jgi:hypothetical protein
MREEIEIRVESLKCELDGLRDKLFEELSEIKEEIR